MHTMLRLTLEIKDNQVDRIVYSDLHVIWTDVNVPLTRVAFLPVLTYPVTFYSAVYTQMATPLVICAHVTACPAQTSSFCRRKCVLHGKGDPASATSGIQELRTESGDIAHSPGIAKMHWKEFGVKWRREHVAGSWCVWANSDSELNYQWRSLQPFTGCHQPLAASMQRLLYNEVFFSQVELQTVLALIINSS